MSSSDPQASAQAARSRSNLAFALVSLEKHRRDAMGIFYDFCRLIDDIADEPVRTTAQKYGELLGWQDTILSWPNPMGSDDAAKACYPFPENTRSILPEGPLSETLRAIAERYAVNPRHLIEIVGGCAHDVEPHFYPDFPSLKKYCYAVASAVGLVSIRIFGCTAPQSEDFAEALGYALQFTNILRDIREDYEEKGRLYLPQDEMNAFGVTPDILFSDTPHSGREKLLRLQYFRAKHFFNKARRLLTHQDQNALKAALVMKAIYEAILEKIKDNGFSLKKRVSLSKPKKVFLLWKTMRQLKKPLSELYPAGKAAVFGAGVAGIGAAVWLAKEGFDVDVFEARKVAGGRACSMDDRQYAITLDNGQHIAMGCYRHFLDLAQTLGVAHKLHKAPALDVTYVSKGGQRERLRAKNWPCGLGLALALLRFKALGLKDKWAIVRLALAIRFGAHPRPDETAESWLARHGQTARTRYALWHPFCVAALNQPLDKADAVLLRETVRRSLLAGPQACAIYISKPPLGDLFYPEAARFLQSVDGAFHMGSQVSKLDFENGRCAGFFIKGETAPRTAGLMVSALNYQALAALLPENLFPARSLRQMEASPIVSVHIYCAQKLFDEPFVGFLDSPVHWVFDRCELLDPAQQGKVFLYAVTLSTPGPWMDAGRDSLVDMIHAEFTTHFSQCAPITFVHTLVMRSRDATFAAVPQTRALRPSTDAIPGLLLCGDYVATDLPSTLESAADSARRVADTLDTASTHR